ncbi:MAG: 4-hydroxy-tetrahydrodipicolinate reductase [Pseudomonadota bacterium]
MSTSAAIGVVSCAGRMGRTILSAVIASADCRLAGTSQYEGHSCIGSDAGTLAGSGNVGCTVSADPATVMAAADAVIDFSTPEATMAHLAAASTAGTPLVVGTTGLSRDQREALRRASERSAVLFAPNMSVGATLLTEYTRRLAATLDDTYDIEILGLQHRHKVDAPSGTALALARAAAEGRGLDPETVGATPRDGHTGARPVGAIGMATVQGGSMLGEHSAIFAGTGERLELAHRPGSRDVYATGAVRAALWLAGQKPGLYGMRDALGLAIR